MRAFLGLEVPEGVNARLDLALAAPIRKSPPARWTAPENRHLTLAFLGTVGEAALEPLEGELAAVLARHEPLELEFCGGGVFPVGKPARVVWVGFRSSARLGRLQADLVRACTKLGFSVEDRPYTPHLTLARCKPLWPASAGEAWRHACSELLGGSDSGVSYKVDRTCLFESLQESRGVRYRVFRSYPLSRSRASGVE